MFVFSTIRSHPFHHRCLKTSWLVPTNRDVTMWLASQLFPLPCCCPEHSQLSQFLCLSEWNLPSIDLVYYSGSCTLFSTYIYGFYIFWFYPYFCYWYLRSSDKELVVLRWKCVSIFVTVLLTQSRTSGLYLRGRQRHSFFDWNSVSVITMTTPKCGAGGRAYWII